MYGVFCPNDHYLGFKTGWVLVKEYLFVIHVHCSLRVFSNGYVSYWYVGNDDCLDFLFVSSYSLIGCLIKLHTICKWLSFTWHPCLIWETLRGASQDYNFFAKWEWALGLSDERRDFCQNGRPLCRLVTKGMTSQMSVEQSPKRVEQSPLMLGPGCPILKAHLHSVS